MPLALAGTLLGAATLSTLAQLALAGMVPATASVQWPEAFAAQGWHGARLFVNIGEVVLLPLVVLLSFLPQPELLGAMAKDGIIPEGFGRSDASGTYVRGSLLSGAVMVLVAAAVPFYILWDMISLGVLLGFNLTNTSLIMVRYGNGGQVRAQGLVYWVAGFWAMGATGAYTLWKGVVGPALEGNHWHSWLLILSAMLLSAALVMLVCIARHEEFDAEESAQLFRTPAVPFVPGLAIILNFTLMATLPWRDHFCLLGVILACVGVYAIKSVQRVAEFSMESESADTEDSAETSVELSSRE